MPPLAVADRLRAWNWDALRTDLDATGAAMTPPLLDPDECRGIAALFDRDGLFRSTVEMARHGYGEGTYRYFADPLPPLVAALREAAYPHLAPLARAWAPAIGLDHSVPDTLSEFRAVCAGAGQNRPTPLLLRYRAGGWNALHQDLYGGVVFPVQMAILLSAPGRDFTGGQFLLTEQRPRMQSRGHAFDPVQGQAILFATRHRSVRGARGTYRVTLRHGVSTVTSGERLTLGIIFHDAA